MHSPVADVQRDGLVVPSVRLGGAVPFRQVADERLDPMQRGTAGFEERSEREDGWAAR
ncbi:hypothetical protein [Streptomyces sp. NPDC058297]|uniref:hypothetical protein n=1 Tax=unclassified Streptomyces TaxID=2593676 RepID=UPI0036E18406